jgi:hypothetical protein
MCRIDYEMHEVGVSERVRTKFASWVGHGEPASGAQKAG